MIDEAMKKRPQLMHVPPSLNDKFPQTPLESIPVIKSPFSTVFTSPSFPGLPGSFIPTDRDFEGFADDRQSRTSLQSMLVSVHWHYLLTTTG